MYKSTLRLTIFTCVLLLAVIGLQWTSVAWLHPYLLWLIGFYWLQFFLINLLTSFLEKSLGIDTVYILLGGVTARLLVAMMVMVIAVIVKIEQTKLFIINFAILYLHYLVFEIIGVLSNLRSNLKQG